MRRKEQQGGRSDMEEGATRCKEERGGKRDEDERVMRKVKKIKKL